MCGKVCVHALAQHPWRTLKPTSGLVCRPCSESVCLQLGSSPSCESCNAAIMSAGMFCVCQASRSAPTGIELQRSRLTCAAAAGHHNASAADLLQSWQHKGSGSLVQVAEWQRVMLGLRSSCEASGTMPCDGTAQHCGCTAWQPARSTTACTSLGVLKAAS